MSMRIVCLEADSVKARFRPPRCEHDWVAYPNTAADEVLARLRGAQVAIVNKVRLDADTLAALPALRLVAVAATGTDNVDLAACAEHGIVVSNVRGYATHAVPEHALMLMLALRRRLFAYVDDVRSGMWAGASGFCLFHHPVGDLNGATLGIVGRGGLGQAVARLAEAFGMTVLFAERRGADSVREGYTDFDTVLRTSDVLSLHCPLNDATRGLIGAAELAAMKNDAILVNVSRGGLVDEQALADALRAGTIAGAGVDVLSQEPPRDGNPLLDADLPNLIVTPHMAWASAGAMKALTDQVIDNIEAFAAGRPRNRVV
ncbi:MAG TPA: D-2-hydroxyacid dehydrogenase [Rhodocyclaceae bacterium]|nr:D-2-hydroxyacid dehydrogenase [Rhodocyclaceae bacterium]